MCPYYCIAFGSHYGLYGGGAGGQSGRNGQGGLDNLWRMAAPGCAPCNLLFGCSSAALRESVFISVISGKVFGLGPLRCASVVAVGCPRFLVEKRFAI